MKGRTIGYTIASTEKHLVFQVDWQAGNVLRPETYSHLHDVTAAVHTLGTLIEDTRYKTALKNGDLRMGRPSLQVAALQRRRMRA